ncbi:MAG: 4Fe-4S dicluster domain-containing protein [Promethearchaeota archaeon]|nr:MAG: 4Fe-4S dicluster domain-containing protein [Candidatus Lokiarchaeota archaeon]
MEITPEQLILNWHYQDVDKELVYDIKKCIGCSLCKLVCPVDAIELGPIPEIAQEILDESNPKILIDHEKCCYCMLCAIVCPNDAFHENIKPEGKIDLNEFPSVGKFYEIEEEKCIEDSNNEICQLCLKVRDRNNVKDYFKIQKECPTKCFHIASPIEGEVIIKKNMLWKCDPQGCKACVNICPTESFFIPESAEDVLKYGKIACDEDACFYCGACENSCPDDLIIVDRENVEIKDPLKKGNFPWIEGWIKNIKEILRKRLIKGKEPINIPLIEQEVEKVKEKLMEEVPQLSEQDKKKLNELNDKIQSLLRSQKIRYWIKDKKTDKITKAMKKQLS